jgi:hypothetical protein
MGACNSSLSFIAMVVEAACGGSKCASVLLKVLVATAGAWLPLFWCQGTCVLFC